MKSSFILYIVCMKFLDPESHRYCATGRIRHESPWKLTFFMDTDGNGPQKPRYIRAQRRGLHRVKPAPRREQASETFLARVFRGKTNRPRGKTYIPAASSSFLANPRLSMSHGNFILPGYFTLAPLRKYRISPSVPVDCCRKLANRRQAFVRQV